ncbi:MAG: hypothetical protein AB1540_16365 [Bdellovibrionota bacterium]
MKFSKNHINLFLFVMACIPTTITIAAEEDASNDPKARCERSLAGFGSRDFAWGAWNDIVRLFTDNRLSVKDTKDEPFVDSPRLDGRPGEWLTLHPEHRTSITELAGFAVSSRVYWLIRNQQVSQYIHATVAYYRPLARAKEKLADHISRGGRITAEYLKLEIDPLFTSFSKWDPDERPPSR